MFLVIILFIFTQLWNATDASAGGVEALTGFSVAQMIWYLVFSEAIVMSTSPAMHQEVDREVTLGRYRLSSGAAAGLPAVPFRRRAGRAAGCASRLNLVIGVVVALIVVGPIPLAPLSVLAALITAVFAFVVDFLISFTISTLSFWFEDTDGLHLLL